MVFLTALPVAAEPQRPGEDEPLPPEEHRPAQPVPPPRLDLPPEKPAPRQEPPQSVMGRALRLQHDVEERLGRDPDLSGRRIVVVTDARGGVTLMGEVASEAERARAVRLARGAGATRVTSQLRTAKQRGSGARPPAEMPQGMPRSLGGSDSSDPDQAIMESIEAALRRDPSTERADIRVDAVNGSVILRGTVPSEAARARAVDIARGTPGVTKIVEDLFVPALP